MLHSIKQEKIHVKYFDDMVSTAAVAAGTIIVVAALVVVASVCITLPIHHSLNPLFQK